MGAVLYFFREDRGRSRQELAELCGWSDKRIDKYERGESNPSIDSLELLAAHLGLTPNDLLKGREAWLSYLTRIHYIDPPDWDSPPVVAPSEIYEGTGLLPGDLQEEWKTLLEDEERLRRKQGELARRRDQLEHKTWAGLTRP